jgi:hypothetical protein
MKNKIDLVKELMITGEVKSFLRKDWIMENILNITKKSLRKDKIKKIFNV